MNIYGFSTFFNGNEMARQLIERGIALTGIIGLRPSSNMDSISGYESARDLCARYGMKYVEVDTYNLSASKDREKLEALDVDLALILGWQRLLPNWFLERCRLGTIGAHGSASGITGGRGRSPQNWALMLGKTEFHLSIFFADPGIDSGPVIDSRAVPLSQWDDIRSSHLKLGRAVVEMIAANLDNGHIARHEAAQQHGEVRYLPQRKPEDGAIDWNRSAISLYNFVRALTRPYPGAFAPVPGGVLHIWKARPFVEAQKIIGTQPGQIVDVFENDDFLVQTGDGLLLVDNYEIEGAATSPKGGDVLQSCSFVEQIKSIVARHYAKYPDLKVSRDIENIMEGRLL